jgi:glyoxylase-like metal-dependent hydrolase (beta-lactamase superfamily II)
LIKAIAPALALLLLASAAQAQQRDFDKVSIRTQPLTPNVAVLFGEGGNIGVSHGQDGTVLIDDQYAPLTPRIAAAVAAIPATPVKFVINTHWHGDHSGGNENLGKAGAVIIAQDHVRQRMSTEQVSSFLKRTTPPSPKAALPVITFHHEVTLHLNGDTISVTHVPHAHTDGDALVKFVGANILHTGDVFVRYGLPFIDTESGGSARGMIAAQDAILALADTNTRIIPGHGEVATRADVAAFRTMLETIVNRVEAGIKAGKTLAQIQAEKPAAEWDTNPKAFVTGEPFVAGVYASLMAPPAGHHKGGGHPHH